MASDSSTTNLWRKKWSVKVNSCNQLNSKVRTKKSESCDETGLENTSNSLYGINPVKYSRKQWQSFIKQIKDIGSW